MTPAAPSRTALLSTCAFMLQAANLTIQDLAIHMGVALQSKPIEVAPVPIRTTDLAVTGRWQEALAHASRPEGVAVTELVVLMGLAEQTAWQYLNSLHCAQRVVRVKAVGVRGTRYFADSAAAAAWSEGIAATATEQDMRRVSRAAARQAARQAAEEKRRASAARQAERLAARAAKAAPPKPEPKSPFSKAKPKKATKPVHPILIGDAIETAATRRVVDATKRPNSRIEAAPALPPDPRFPSFASVRYGAGADAKEGRA